MTYSIYEDFFPAVSKKLNRVAKKCANLGCDFKFEVIGEEIREIKKSNFKFINIDVEGTAIVNDWELVAIMEFSSNGNIIRKVNNSMDVPEKFWHSDNRCDHCGSQRANRKNLFIIHNVVTDEWKQVGGKCVGVYTHGLSMELIASYMDGITELEANNGIVGDGGKVYYKVKDVVSLAYSVVKKFGYFNASSFLPTKYLVGNIFYARDGREAIAYRINEILEKKHIDNRIWKEDIFTDDSFDMAEKIVEYYNSLSADNEFIHNVQTILANGYCTLNEVGFLSYLPAGYAKHIANEEVKAKRLAEAESVEYFGEIGKRYTHKISKITVVSTWVGDFGIVGIYNIYTEEGAVLTWKTTSDIHCDSDESYDKITFTVKNHGEYRGNKQTEVTRCRITKVSK